MLNHPYRPLINSLHELSIVQLMLILDQKLVIFVDFVLNMWQRSLYLLLLAIGIFYLKGVLLHILLL